jgi:hypothetical protein
MGPKKMYAGRDSPVMPLVTKSVLNEDVAHVVDVAAAECGTIFESPVENACFSGEELEHLADCHAGRETVRVHDYVWGDA